MSEAGEPQLAAQSTDHPTLTGVDFQRMLAAASAWLDQHADAIDAINVFPVPDGDTGRNMAQTLRAAVEAAAQVPPDAPLSGVARAAADGALLGARGNSGVILSQWMRGFARALESESAAGTGLLGQALARGSESAYAAIEKPREGTILSVARAAADCGPDADAYPIDIALAGAVARAETAVARTPQQMPLLAHAGVVDSGAQGLAVVLQGLHQGLVGRDHAVPAADFGRIRDDWLAGAAPGEHSHDSYGFCTEFVLSGDAIDLETVRAALDKLGDSLVVAGDERLVRVHLHTDDPEAAFDTGRGFGQIDKQTTDDMDARHADLMRRVGPGETVTAVAVTSGEGFAQLFRELGAEIVDGGATRNPSAAEILNAAKRSGGRDVLVLPNDPNVIAAARQAAELQAADGAGIRLHVVPTDSQQAAVAALSVWDRAAPADEAHSRMAEAAGSLLTGAVTHAARAIEQPLLLRQGQPFAMLGKEIVAGADTPEAALAALVDHLLDRWRADGRGAPELLSVYTGNDIDDPPSAEHALRDHLAAPDSAVELELVIGGQPHYPFLVSLE